MKKLFYVMMTVSFFSLVNFIESKEKAEQTTLQTFRTQKGKIGSYDRKEHIAIINMKKYHEVVVRAQNKKQPTNKDLLLGSFVKNHITYNVYGNKKPKTHHEVPKKSRKKSHLMPTHARPDSNIRTVERIEEDFNPIQGSGKYTPFDLND